jgi:hypothetical protein
MIPRPGLCIGDDGQPQRVRFVSRRGVKVVVLPRTDPDSLVVDSNTAVVVERKDRIVGGVPTVPGAVLIRVGQKMDCDYEALARIIGHDVARELFKKHDRQMTAA